MGILHTWSLIPAIIVVLWQVKAGESGSILNSLGFTNPVGQSQEFFSLMVKGESNQDDVMHDFEQSGEKSGEGALHSPPAPKVVSPPKYGSNFRSTNANDAKSKKPAQEDEENSDESAEDDASSSQEEDDEEAEDYSPPPPPPPKSRTGQNKQKQQKQQKRRKTQEETNSSEEVEDEEERRGPPPPEEPQDDDGGPPPPHHAHNGHNVHDPRDRPQHHGQHGGHQDDSIGSYMSSLPFFSSIGGSLGGFGFGGVQVGGASSEVVTIPL